MRPGRSLPDRCRAAASARWPSRRMRRRSRSRWKIWCSSPAEASAKVGDTIEWINKDVFAHTATARNGDFDVTMPPKKTVTSVLKKAGTVEYYCRFHPNMKAVLTIAP